MKSETKIFTFVHPVSGDIFTYEDAKHAYKLNGIDLPGTTTPLKLVNELSWDADGKMTDKSQIIQQWAIKMVTNEILDKGKFMIDVCNNEEHVPVTYNMLENIVLEAKKAPNKKFTGAGISGTEIHAECESYIKDCISGVQITRVFSPQTLNFIKWSQDNQVKFLYSEEPIYSKEWMNCGTVDFICEIDGKILIGDIKTNGDKRRYAWDSKLNGGKGGYDYSKPESDIRIPYLWQCGCYGKMCTEPEARKLIDKFDGVVIVNIKKSGEFDPALDVKYDYNVDSLVTAFDLVLKLYKQFRNKYN